MRTIRSDDIRGGLSLREKIPSGPLVRIDDKRFDAMLEAVGSLNMPVAIHSSDPKAFFLALLQTGERMSRSVKGLNGDRPALFRGHTLPMT